MKVKLINFELLKECINSELIKNITDPFAPTFIKYRKLRYYRRNQGPIETRKIMKQF